MAQICGVFRSPSQFLSLDNLGNTYSLKWDLNNSKHKNRNACLAEIGFAFQFCITRPDASGSLCLLSVKKRLCGWFLGMPFFLFPSATWLNVCFHFSGNAWVDVSRRTQPIAFKKKKIHGSSNWEQSRSKLCFIPLFLLQFYNYYAVNMYFSNNFIWY